MQTIKTICICGGGNLGHAFAAVLGSRDELSIRILTRKPEKWSNFISGEDENNLKVTGKVDKISNKAEDVIPKTDLVLISLPCFAREEALKTIAPHLSNNTIIGCMPGNGNFELQANKYLPLKKKNITIFGSLRIPYICRTGEYGKHVRFFKKSEIQIVASNKSTYHCIKTFFETYASIKVTPINSFLELVLCNSNPILHPARLFDLFASPDKKIYPKEIPFYEDWSINASDILIQMDHELFNLINIIPLDLSGVKTLLKHYESTDSQSLTKKINSIKAFKGIMSPMVSDGKMWKADFESRYFTEDIPFGLLLIKSLAEIYNIKTPWIDEVIYWAQKNLHLFLITEEGKLADGAFQFPIFHKYNLTTPEQIIDHYKAEERN